VATDYGVKEGKAPVDLEGAMREPVATSTVLIGFPVPRVIWPEYRRSYEPRARLIRLGKSPITDQVGRADECFETEPGRRQASES
jgi:hypothetical protein